MTVKEMMEGIEMAISDGVPEDAIVEEISAIRYVDEYSRSEIVTINLGFRDSNSHYKTIVGWNSSKQHL